ncbi:riboflavin synthase, beta subunit [Candidatus Protochlamydia naegleriophila]|uniref:6,7-dimethyl-8-ribityllumazine synthase n=1 Tax=Candidatus Protochlamydia naegleriophila TaxID=389348 RepID=A0A0U5JDF7_9BACT|nr:6,7-dimethyl-8-ribityllumazine synthase [Candidatus Protochlamydia naegleriophila]CUI16842.1 riboflavin synthase, beta subunit [Candidatus Protochlamydia naegleriophila]
MKEYKGKLTNSNVRIGIVVARFNDMITHSLLQGALDTLERHGISSQSISVAWVPGAFEIPLIAKKMAHSGQFDAIICLGAVIRGATPHFDYVAGQAASGVANLSLETNLPVIFGVLTTDTIEQAIERAGTKAGNKGSDAALAALEMIDLLRQLQLSCNFPPSLQTACMSVKEGNLSQVKV